MSVPTFQSAPLKCLDRPTSLRPQQSISQIACPMILPVHSPHAHWHVACSKKHRSQDCNPVRYTKLTSGTVTLSTHPLTLSTSDRCLINGRDLRSLPPTELVWGVHSDMEPKDNQDFIWTFGWCNPIRNPPTEVLPILCLCLCLYWCWCHPVGPYSRFCVSRVLLTSHLRNTHNKKCGERRQRP